MNIKESVVLVTGASSGIGEATSRAASKAGAKVVLLARREDRLQKLADELGEALPVRCDVTDAADVARAVDLAVKTFGRIDVLVNNAGQGLQGTVEEIDPDDFRAVLDLNVVAPQIVMRAVVPIMRKQGAGAIVNVGSGISFSSIPGSGGYSASKAALAKLSAIVRNELADAGISVSTMFPFITASEFVDSLRAGHEAARELESNYESQRQKPEQVADAILGLIESGAEQADLVPKALGGSYEG